VAVVAKVDDHECLAHSAHHRCAIHPQGSGPDSNRRSSLQCAAPHGLLAWVSPSTPPLPCECWPLSSPARSRKPCPMREPVLQDRPALFFHFVIRRFLLGLDHKGRPSRCRCRLYGAGSCSCSTSVCN